MCPDFATSQQLIGAAIRSDAWAATEANESSGPISSSEGGSVPRAFANCSIQVAASTKPRFYCPGRSPRTCPKRATPARRPIEREPGGRGLSLCTTVHEDGALPRPPRLFVARLVATAAAVAVGLTSCGAAAKRSASPGAGLSSIGTPLATSVQAGAGTWATLPMGHLGQPLNTFWQLFLRTGGSSSWSDHVEATAVATNGGLVLASSGRSLLVGVRPTNLLTFSPLVATADTGRTWADGLISQALADHPGALAAGAGGRYLAIVATGHGDEVLGSAGSLTSWRPVVTEPDIGSAPGGRACHPTALTAVGYLSDQALVGARCGRPGTLGLWALAARRWQPVGPRLPSGAGYAEVLDLVHSGGKVKVAALIALASQHRTSLMAAWTATGGTWRTSSALPLGEGTRLTSFGGTPDGGLFALVRTVRGQEDLEVTGPAAAASGSAGNGSLRRDGWRRVVAPVGTATVAFGPGATVDALAAAGTIMTVWALSARSTSWSKRQVVHVGIVYGSSG